MRSKMNSQNQMQKKELTSEQKEKITLLKQYGLFLAIIIVIFGIIFSSALFSRNSWKEGLKNQVESVLLEQKKDYTVGDFMQLQSPFSTSCAVYNINQKGKKNTNKYAVIIRLTTLYGQIPAIYIYDSKESDVSFLKMLTLNGASEKQIVDISKHMQISFWAKRIPSIIENSNINEGNSKNEK